MGSDRTLSVRTRIALLLAVPFALCVVLVGAFQVASYISETGYATALAWREHAVVVVQEQAAAAAYVATVEDAVRGGVVDEGRQAAAVGALEAARAHALLLAASFDADEKAAEAELSRRLRALIERGTAVSQSRDPGQLAALRDYFQHEVATMAAERVHEELEGSKAAAEDGRVASLRIQLVASAIAIVLMIFGLGLCVRFAGTIRGSLVTLTQAAQRVAAGDLAISVPTSGHDELARVGEAFNLMADHLRTTMVHKSELEVTNAELSLRRGELEVAVVETRKMQEELMRSSRLAAVGEMAGRTAHEVLNPAQSLHGRLTRIATHDLPSFRDNIDVLQAIVAGWREALAGGAESLVRALSEPAGDTTILEADLAALEELVDANREFSMQTVTDVEFLRNEVDRITRTVDGMRSLSRQTSSITRHPLAPILAEACEIVRDSAHKRNIELRWSAPEHAIVELDRYELLQVLNNLMRNALLAIEARHNRTGGLLELRTAVRDDRIVIEVRDDGSGIAPEHLPVIFEPTFTTRSASEGTGLGLSIARRLARQMGGDVDVVDTKVGEGTTFVIVLPIAAPRTTETHAGHDSAAA